MTPVQLDWGGSRNDIAFVMASGLPGSWLRRVPGEVADQADDIFGMNRPTWPRG